MIDDRYFLANPSMSALWQRIKLMFEGHKNIREAKHALRNIRAEMNQWADGVAALKAANMSLSHSLEKALEEKKELEQRVQSLSFMDVNAKCPVCGHMKGHIESFVNPKVREAGAIHICETCGFRFAEGPMLRNAMDFRVPTELKQQQLPPAGPK